MSPALQISETDVLVAVDVQNDFCPGGRLAVPRGDEVVAPINRLIERFAHVVLTQDWHPPRHGSFASSHVGAQPFGTFEAPYGPQTLWPDHCVQGTTGAAFRDDLVATKAELVVRKGYDPAIDSYSAFFENDRTTPTGLGGYLAERGFSRVFLAGLAFDFCVRWSAEDARRLGFAAIVLDDACRALDLDGSLAATYQALREHGVELSSTAAIVG